MCGIAGVVSGSSPHVSPEILGGMVASLRHRGPDDQGTRIFDAQNTRTGLGHARLSIIDLSEAGHQPMCNEDGTVWITYNGEIYNHLDLRADLEARGHVFTSHTDTEAIIHGYEEYGEGIFRRLNGMFAIGLWDTKTASLFLARDRYGKKPLYYWHTGDTLVFASEIKALLRHPGTPRAIDPEGLSRYLLHEYVPSPHSILKGVRKLLPGHFLCFRNAVTSERPYWSMDFSTIGIPQDPRAVCEILLDKLTSSVRRRLMSDVPLGVFLSGGIDSSAIVALMAEIVNAGRIKTFSIGFEEESFDESGYARMVARRFGTEHHEQVLTPQKMIDILPEVWGFLDEPFADASVIPTYLLSRFTREHVTVALGGDGGDELFAGYDPFLAHRLAGLYDWVPRFIHAGIVEPLASRLRVSTDNMSMDFRIRQFLKGIPYPRPIRNQVWLGSFSREEQHGILTREYRELCSAYDPYRAILEAETGMRFRDSVDEVVFLFLRFYLADDILTKIDRASMATSLEVRAPFLDMDFAGFVNSLPSAFKLHGLTRKYILKKALESRLPREILYRKKKGFGVPLSKWFRQDLCQLLLDVFSPERIRREGIFDAGALKRLIDDHLSGIRDNRKQLWTLLMFEQWRHYHLS